MSVRPVLTSGNVIFSLKTFLAAMLAYLIAISFDLDRPYWAVATVYIVAHPLSGAISSKSVFRLLGTLVGSFATLIMVPNLVNEPILLSGAIVLWVAACTFISLLDRTPRSYVSLLAGYTVLLAGLPLVSAPANTFDTVVSRVEEIGLAIICASVVSHIVFPVHVGAVLINRIDGWMDRVRTLLEATAAGKLSKTQSRVERHALAAEAADLRSFNLHLQYDRSRYRWAVSLVRSMQHRMAAFLPLLSEMEDLRRSLRKLNTSGATQALAIITDAALHTRGSAEILDSRIDALTSATTRHTWEKLLLANAARTVRNILRLANECRALRKSMEGENNARIVRVPHRRPAQHRDIGMALLSSLTVAVCLATSIFFWIESGWADGMTFAQISGVLCCLLATMDDPVPAMRKFVGVTMCSVMAAFVYNFTILPVIDGFVPLIAALGLFLVPAGICLAVPSLAIVGMGLCINFPLLLTLQAYPRADFVTFSNAAVATILAMVWTISVCGIFRSVRAETNARRFFSVTRKHVANIAAGKYSNAHVTYDRMIDIAGLFASRAAKVPTTSDIWDGDLLRDLRAGLHLTAMLERIETVSGGLQVLAKPIFPTIRTLYQQPRAGRGERLKNAVSALDDLILSAEARTAVDIELLSHAVALRVCIAPDAFAPTLKTPSPNRRAA
ncbi:FUSC family protein [Agrobacterium fabrum]|uniref:FUSC family protein n=1 Tax=Agrobacterium fabrum TaxID=1176649 RepID=UPI00273D400A|nr:FUSC family protein [Agrobacterium fabrum]WLP57413.1 FUSC family protein [Agrobacterium fabrum]